MTYTVQGHPIIITTARARRLLKSFSFPVNHFWLSGCGRRSTDFVCVAKSFWEQLHLWRVSLWSGWYAVPQLLFNFKCPTYTHNIVMYLYFCIFTALCLSLTRNKILLTMWASSTVEYTVNEGTRLSSSFPPLSVHWSMWLDFNSSHHHMNSHNPAVCSPKSQRGQLTFEGSWTWRNLIRDPFAPWWSTLA